MRLPKKQAVCCGVRMIKKLRNHTKNPWLVGIATFIFFNILLHWFFKEIFGSIRCWDGYPSPSIGKPGACSHHGGVNNSRHTYIFVISLILAILNKFFICDRKNPFSIIRKNKYNDNRPCSPYGSKEKHKAILLKSGADIESVTHVLDQYADD